MLLRVTVFGIEFHISTPMPSGSADKSKTFIVCLLITFSSATLTSKLESYLVDDVCDESSLVV